MVTTGRTEEEAHLNAKLSISIARKMGATIWYVVLLWFLRDGGLTRSRLVPEDICAVRSRLIVTFVGSLMATYEQGL